MRKITTDAINFNLSNDDIVNIKLLDKSGNELTTTYEKRLINFNKDVNIQNNKLEVELFENDKLNIFSYYEITIKGIKFRFSLNSSKDNLAHELTSLLQLGSNDGIACIVNDELILEDDFIKKIELKFINQEPYFTENQERVFNFLIFYADNVHGKDLTIDIIKKIDNHIGGINGK